MSSKNTKKKVKKNKSKKDTIQQMVKKEVARNIEDKTFESYWSDYVIVPSNSSTFATQVIPISPYTGFLQIDQGTSQGQRIGNRIKLKSLKFSGVITPLPYNGTSNPQPRPSFVVFWFYSYKPQPTIEKGPDNTFLQLGGSSMSLANKLSDVGAPLNTNNWMYLGRKVYKIGYEAYVGTGALSDFGNFSNTDFKLAQFFKIDCLDMAVKNVQFNDNSSDPTTRLVICCPQAIAVTSQYVASTVPVTMDYSLSCTYEDA